MPARRIVVSPQGGGIFINTPSPLPQATQSVPYSFSLSALGVVGSSTWSLIAGALDPGLSLSSAGVISGTPVNVATYLFTAQIVDSIGNTYTKQFSLTVVSGAGPGTLLILFPQNMPPMAAGQPVQFTLQAVGPGITAPLSWSISPASPFSIDASGTLTGLAPAGTNSFTITVNDSASHFGSEVFTCVAS